MAGFVISGAEVSIPHIPRGQSEKSDVHINSALRPRSVGAAWRLQHGSQRKLVSYMKRDQIQLFELQIEEPPLEVRIEKSKQTIYKLFQNNTPVCVAFSGGKDSTVCADLVLCAARDASLSGIKPLVVVTTGDTLVENPEVSDLYRKELKKIAAFGKANGFQVITRIATPALLSTWQLKVLSGRGLPSFPSQNVDCSWDMKIQPQARLRKELFQKLRSDGMQEPVTVIGTRFDESDKRALKMELRGERDDVPVSNGDGDLILSPICDWSTDDVFEYLGTRGSEDAYSDFKDTLRIYAHSEGQSCAVVAAAIEEGMSKRRKGGCGARTGCHVCQQATDKSLENLIKFDDRYSYAKGLNRLNTFIRNTRYDYSRRHWIGRTIKGGYIAIEPDTYHPTMVREIFRYMIQLQHDERRRAAREGGQPKFTLFSDEMVLALDAYWSLTGLAMPFSAWVDVDDIQSGRVRYDIPDVELTPPQKMPDTRFLYVGEEWDDSSLASDLTGFRDAYQEALLEVSNCKPDLKTLKSGRVVWDIETEPNFEIDGESLAMFQDFELDRLLNQNRTGLGAVLPGAITRGYLWYVQYGVIQLTGGQKTKHDEILRRTAHKDRLGLCLNYEINDLLAQSVRFADMPKEAREKWSKKATTSSAQADLTLY